MNSGEIHVNDRSSAVAEALDISERAAKDRFRRTRDRLARRLSHLISEDD